ncbi:MAG: DUF2029 domain-containing protein [Thermoleophilia bacterium]|nr:DUF2029 domain-containing protein [Thermoleophilia bacterium]
MSASPRPSTAAPAVSPRPPVAAATLAAAARRVGSLLVFAVGPVALTVAVLQKATSLGVGFGLGFDYGAVWRAGRRILDGASPYPAPVPEHLIAEDQYVYPPITAIVGSPLSLLPFDVAAAAVSLLLIGAVALTLWVLGVRDWRCYGAAFLAGGVLHGIRLGAMSALLALGVALAWRYRHRTRVVALTVALLVAAKLFLWPLGVWLLATRRYAAAALAALGGLVAVVVPWALIGFDGLRDYPELLRVLTEVLQWKGYSVAALGLSLGLGAGAAKALSYALGAALLAGALVLGRGRDGDFRAFVATVGAAFALTPMLWGHYFVVLLVPIAIRRPRLTPLWVLPMVFWLAILQSFGDPLEIGSMLAAAAVVLAGAVFRPETAASTCAGRRGHHPAPAANRAR